jgi:hypothetical protein
MIRKYDCEDPDVEHHGAPVYSTIKTFEKVILEPLESLERADVSEEFLAAVGYNAIVYDGANERGNCGNSNNRSSTSRSTKP